ncbi:MAG: protein-glutamate O-methyltransferase CheR [Rhodospirillales bacterium]|nr:protein-glutamate O-methyltransferase CheR [Rhodospirillales bacterium]
MTSDDFAFLRDLVKRESGLVLTEEKSYLLESRLTPVARKSGLDSLDDLVAKVRNGLDPTLVKLIVDAMTTNESFFFRDIKPFDIFRDILLPYFIETRQTTKRIRIWCAAASSGQEPYSLAMILREMEAKLAGWKVSILGTDISTEILDKAKNGIYSQFEVQRGLPVQLLVKYFEKHEESWQINSDIRSMINYREFNLLDDPKTLGQFDIVFCRNVLIYFDQEAKSKILGEVSKMLPKDGLLYLGGAETVLGVSDKFRPIPKLRGVYETIDDKKSESIFATLPSVLALD